MTRESWPGIALLLFTLCAHPASVAVAGEVGAPEAQAEEEVIPGAIRGRLVDVEGAPLADVPVRLERLRGIAASMARLSRLPRGFGRSMAPLDILAMSFHGKDGEDPERHEARTAADGRFVLEGIPVGEYRAVARPAGLPPAWGLVGFAEGETQAELELIATPPATLHAVAIDVRGEPVAELPLEWIDPLGELKTILTDAEGRFTLENLPRGRARLVPRREGIRPLVQKLLPTGSSPSSPAWMFIQPIEPLSGRVLRGGKAVKGAKILAARAEKIFTNAVGRFSVPEKTAKFVQATTETASSAALKVNRTQDFPTPLVLKLRPHGRAAVRLRTPDGEPGVGIPVKVHPTWFDAVEVESNREGIAFFPGLPEGEHHVRIEDERWKGRGINRLKVASGQLAHLRVEVVPAAPLRVRLVNAQGELLPEAKGRVNIQSTAGGYTSTPTAGVVENAGIPEGAAKITYRPPTGATTAPVSVVVGEQPSIDLVIPSDEAAPAEEAQSLPGPRGRALAPGGVALPYLDLSISRAPEAPGPGGRWRPPAFVRPVHHRTTTDARGDFTFPSLPPGRYRIFARNRGWALPAEIFVKVEAEKAPAPVELTFLPAALLPGRLIDARGRPARPREISARVPGTAQVVQRAQSDDQGYFLFDQLAAGDYELVAEGSGREARTQASAGGPAVTLRFPEASSALALTVLHRGRPAGSYAVHLGLLRHEGASGKLLLEDLDPGAQELKVKLPGGDEVKVPILLEPGQTLRKTVTLAGPTRLELTIVDEEGRPQAGVQISRVRPRHRAKQRTDVFGEVVFGDLAPEPTTLELRGQFPRAVQVELTPEVGRTSKQTVVVPGGTLRPGQQVTASALPRFAVVMLGGKPVREAEVRVGNAAEALERQTTDDRGRLLLGGAGIAAVTLRVCGEAASFRGAPPRSAQDGVARLLLKLPRDRARALREGRCTAHLPN